MRVVTVPIAAYDPKFRWQLDLFWFAHKRLYGDEAPSKIHAAVVDRNEAKAQRIHTLDWNIDVPHSVCPSVWDWPPLKELRPPIVGNVLPLNIQLGLQYLLSSHHAVPWDDDLVIELTDCDMFHFRPQPELEVAPNALYVSDMYEQWHLHSRGKYKYVIDCYFENGGGYYNGGFVPIIGRVSTFRKIMYEWLAIHLDILKRNISRDINWWAGMYALQAACEKARVDMIGSDMCYLPGAFALADSHYIGHYSVDKRFDKRKFPAVDQDTFENNPYYEVIAAWLKERAPFL